jgi:alpha-galactosidase
MTLLRSLVLASFTICASVAFGAAQQVGDEFLLQTKNTTMAFRKSEGSWLMVHYGAKIENAADASALAWSRWQGGNSLGDPKAASYSVYGSDNDASDMNKFGGLAVTHADGVVSTELKSVNAEIVPDQAGITHLKIELKDTVYPFYVTQHFRAIAASDVIETWIELRHTEPAPVKVVRMDSAALTFPLLAKKYSVMTLAGQWASENQLAEAPIAKGQTVSMTSRSGVHSAFGNNPSFMLSVGAAATETTGRVIGGTLAWSGAWNITLQHDQVDDLFVYAGVDTGNGPYVLDPGKTLVTPKLALTFSATGKGQVSRNFHRWARDVQLRDGHASRPILLNSWEGAYFNFTEKTLTDMMDGVKELGGEMFVVDDGWFARGKYARDDDKRGLGDWVVNEKKLPRGLGALANEAAQRGLKFGIWVEPEMANTTSELAEQHPDWILREKTRPLRQGRGGTQVVLDMTNPAVRDNIFGQMDAMIASMPELAYIKWDANADFMNAGSAHLGADRQANLWYDYTDGLYNLLGRLHEKYPKLAIQACSSGGGHMDYGFLRYADEFWTSDDTDARQRVFIQWGASQFFPAVAMAAHVTVSPNQYTGRTTPLKFRFDVAMSGRLGFELHPKNMSADDIAFSKKAVLDYKRIRPVVQQGNLYRLVSPWENTYASLMYVNDEQTHAVVFLYGLNRFVQADYAPPLLLQGLDPAKHYRVTEIDAGKTEHSRVNGTTLDGASLEAMGLPVKLEGDYDSAVFELTAD